METKFSEKVKMAKAHAERLAAQKQRLTATSWGDLAKLAEARLARLNKEAQNG